MATFICFLQPARPTFLQDVTPAETATVDAHFAYLQDLLAKGTLVLAGRTDEPHPVGLVILRAADFDAARALVAADPAVAGGIFSARVVPYRAALGSGS